MFSSSWASSSAPAAASAVDPDAFDLAEEYGAEAAAKLARLLRELEAAGFPKARANVWSAFDRVLSGAAWLLQRLVPREDALLGRVQWDVLFQSHSKMKPRLGFAQELVRCVEALPFACPIPIQPHQLLLQDFGDIETVQRLITWLVAEAQDAPHLERIRSKREYLAALEPTASTASTPLKKEVRYLQETFAPRRRWQYTAATDSEQESEDALIQRCLLEYGERVSVDVEDAAEDEEEGTPPSSQVDFMAHIASQAAAIASGGVALTRGSAKLKTTKRAKDPQAAAFDRQYQKAVKQALAEQQALLNQRRERETQLLQRVVSVPVEEPDGTEVKQQLELASTGRKESPLQLARAQLKEHEAQVQQLIEEKRTLDAQTKEGSARVAALEQALAEIQQELEAVDAQTPKDEKTQAQLATLRQLMLQKEALKREKNAFRAKCRVELDELKTQIQNLKLQMAEDVTHQDKETLRLLEIEQMHSQMARKHTDLKLAVAEQTRALHLKRKQLDEIPTRIELVQYEKRFVELYDEVALTLDETRKYYCVYNTLKTTHEFLEKEVSLINSIHENFEVAMSSKTATEAFFTQMDDIIQNVEGTVAKQQATRDAHQTGVETLDSKYQLLLEQERTYVNAVREFQKECEKNEKLAARIQELAKEQQ
ncbi:hypothetical protein BBJ28_00013442 [Nothophytophthora sp. Chile5]|nr:hypothetical protein BBJ28_00013442 [Nothophytophthora sp. Chile5]